MEEFRNYIKNLTRLGKEGKEIVKAMEKERDDLLAKTVEKELEGKNDEIAALKVKLEEQLEANCALKTENEELRKRAMSAYLAHKSANNVLGNWLKIDDSAKKNSNQGGESE